MKVLLVKPHLSLKVARMLHGLLHLEPLELEIVAGGISKDHDVKIVDLSLCCKPRKEFICEIRSFKPDLIGFTAYSNQARSVLELAEFAKQELPQVINIVGGVHATIEPQYFKGKDVIDGIVRGEGGTVIENVIASLEKDKILPENESVIPLTSPQFDKLASLPPPLIPDYSTLPAPRRDLVDSAKYYCIWAGEKNERMKTLFPKVATVRTSTGCPHRCNFCVVHYLANGKYLQRTPEDVVDEIESLEQDHIYFVDDEMFINAKRTEKIANLLIERGVKKRYISWARSDTICAHPELFKLWKEAGLSTLYVGMESMEKEELDGFNKGYEPDDNRRAVNILEDAGICLHAAFMVMPEFEEKDFINLRHSVESIGTAEVTFTVFSPSPGTSLWNENRDKFIVDDPYFFYDCMHTILPLKLPMNRFYRYFSLLSLFALRNNPWRRRKIKAPLKDMFRMFIAGVRYGHALRNIYKDYELDA
jgi:hopanoid C-3 methylase